MQSPAPDNRHGLRDITVPAAIILACILSRLPFTGRLLYNMDSVQFALGMLDFDVALHQPQPPGYYLYVLMGRAACLLTGDANKALVSVSLVFSGLAAVMLYVLARELFGGTTGITAAVIGITSPLVWFHGEVALSYMPEAFMSLLVAWLCLKAVRGGYGFALAASVALALAGGIRQNTMVFLAPLWLYSIYGLGLKRSVICVAAFGLTVSAWFLPMLAETGGYERYNAALEAHWLDANWRGIHLHWIAFNARYMLYFFLSGLVLAAVPLIDFALGALRGRHLAVINRSTAIFFMLWLSPAVLFHLLIFTHPAVPGHSLIYMVGLMVLAARAVDFTVLRVSTAVHPASAVTTRAGVVGLIAVVNTLFFIFAPYPLSANGIAEHDGILSAYIKGVRDRFSPKDTEIIGSDRFMYSYRHAMYYLPEFKVYDTVPHSTPEGRRLFWGRDRVTHMARYIEPGPGITRFVDFMNYDESQRGSLPEEAVVDGLGGGSLLVHYDGTGGLYRVDRAAKVISPRLKRQEPE